MLIFLTAVEGAFAVKSTTDDALIERIAKGDMDAFCMLYENVSGSIYGFVLSIVKNAYVAEDVLQDTFLTIHQTAGSYKPMGKPMAWILTIARNLALMKLREDGRVAALDTVQIEQGEAFSRIQAVEDRVLIEKLLTALDSEERQIVMLHAVSGLKNREIALLLGLPLNTVLSKYHRAIKKLKALAEREGASNAKR